MWQLSKISDLLIPSSLEGNPGQITHSGRQVDSRERKKKNRKCLVREEVV